MLLYIFCWIIGNQIKLKKLLFNGVVGGHLMVSKTQCTSRKVYKVGSH